MYIFNLFQFRRWQRRTPQSWGAFSNSKFLWWHKPCSLWVVPHKRFKGHFLMNGSSNFPWNPKFMFSFEHFERRMSCFSELCIRQSHCLIGPLKIITIVIQCCLGHIFCCGYFCCSFLQFHCKFCHKCDIGVLFHHALPCELSTSLHSWKIFHKNDKRMP